ncbi:MAG: NAD(P)/FAD-dependent oxidoreductase [Deltaproteobacteria bacterium]|nr:NAD(P)/FAD-dependent oxidoreductase [Deltaproteobacteria bacterium]
MTRHVIIGGGPAGMAAIEAIRATEGEASSITLISDEPAYSRMVLPYYLAREIPEVHVMIGDQAYFSRQKVEPLLGVQVQKVDTQARTLTLSDGKTLPFDTLLIATGSSAQQPPIPGIDQDGVHSFWTLDDARKVIAKGQGTPEAVLVGAGFIGFIVLNAMAKLGWKLSVVEMEGQVLPRMLDRQGAAAVEGWLRARGVALHTGAQVREIARAGSGGKLTLSLSTGATLSADLVILATGIRPNVEFLSGSGLTLNGGVVVNERMQTNIPGIYAAGDVAAGPDLLSGQSAIHAIQPTAVDHGRIAGTNMAGKEARYPGSLLINVLDVIKLHCASFGVWREDGREVSTVSNPTRPIYRKYVWEGDRLVGAIFVGPIDDVTMLNDVGMAKGLIQAKKPLGLWAKYVRSHPTDLRRAYVASGVADTLVRQTLLGAPAHDRDYRMNGLKPPPWNKAPHAPLVGTRPAKYTELKPTPTPGIGKNK